MDGEAGSGLQQVVRDAVRTEIGGMFEELRRFLDRRIAELSTEIHATVELVDVSETHLIQQLQRMHRQLSSVVALPAAATRNSGLELEAIVQATEDAANRILGAAEKITAALESADAKPLVLEQLNAIFEACSFQDLTSQRVRRVIDQLKAVDATIGQLAGWGSGHPEPLALDREITASGPELAQDEVDRLMVR